MKRTLRALSKKTNIKYAWTIDARLLQLIGISDHILKYSQSD